MAINVVIDEKLARKEERYISPTSCHVENPCQKERCKLNR